MRKSSLLLRYSYNPEEQRYFDFLSFFLSEQNDGLTISLKRVVLLLAL